MMRLSLSALGVLGIVAAFASFPEASERSPAAPVKIGMVQSIFTDVPPVLINFLGPQFNSLVKEFTGLPGHMTVGKDAYDVGQQLTDGSVQFGVFHGIEFGWARQKYPDLKPLMVAIYKHRNVHAHLVVRNDSEHKNVGDLKGKDIGLPLFTKEHCRIYLKRQTLEAAQCDPKAFFAKVLKPLNAESALDEVVGGELAAALVDTTSLECYQDVKPGCFRRLKVLKVSENFPVAVIAYKEGMVPAAVITRFREGMMNANKSERGRDMMNTFKISGFEPIPAGYLDQVANIVKLYPAPTGPAAN